MPVPGLQTVQRDDPLAQQFAVRLVVYRESQSGQIWQHDLPEQEGLLVIDRIQTVGGHHSGAELLAYGVGR